MQAKRILLILGVTISLASPAHAERYATQSRFGLGLEVGAPVGLNMKYFLGGMAAVQGGIGVVESWGYDGLHAHAEVVWHPAMLARTRSVDIPFHVGVGGRYLDHDDDYMGRCWNGRYYESCWGEDTHLGVRVPVGLSFIFRKVPMDLFLELAVVLDVVHIDNDRYYEHDHAALNGAFGGRFYF